jgi:hypothetical protein
MPDVAIPHLGDDEARVLEPCASCFVITLRRQRPVVLLALNLDDHGVNLVAEVDASGPPLAA